MPLYHKKLLDKLVEKVNTEWDAKWAEFPKPINNDFSSLKLTGQSNAFYQKLQTDIIESFRREFKSIEERKAHAHISVESLRSYLLNQENPVFREKAREAIARYVGYPNYGFFEDEINFDIVSYIDLKEQKTIESKIVEKPSQIKFYHNLVYGLVILTIFLVIFLISRNHKSAIQEPIVKVIDETNNNFKIAYNLANTDNDSLIIEYPEDDDHLATFGRNYEVLKGKSGTSSHTFFIPNIYKVNFKVGNQQVDSLRKIVKSDKKWFTMASGIENGIRWREHQIESEKTIKNGFLHLEKSFIEDTHKSNYFVSYRYVDDFEVDGDNLIFETKIKNSQTDGGYSAYDFRIILTDEKSQAIDLNLLEDFPEYALLTIGKSNWSGQTKPIPEFNIDLQNWRLISIETKKQEIIISIDKKQVFRKTYQGNLSKIKSILFGTKGSGSVDFVRLSDIQKEKLVFEDTFDHVK